MQMQTIFMRTIADCCHRQTPSAEHSNEKKSKQKSRQGKGRTRKILGKEFH